MKRGRTGIRQTAKHRKRAAPKTAEQYFRRPHRSQETWSRVAHVIAKMRSGSLSLTRAAREVGISRDAVKRWAKTALRKNTAGRYVAKKTDRLLRVLQIPGKDGPREVAVRNSREATILGEYSAALGKYTSTGDDSDLKRFTGMSVIDVNGARVPLLTDLREIDRLAGAGVLSFESLYAHG